MEGLLFLCVKWDLIFMCVCVHVCILTNGHKGKVW
jgi:hypothetical protein